MPVPVKMSLPKGIPKKTTVAPKLALVAPKKTVVSQTKKVEAPKSIAKPVVTPKSQNIPSDKVTLEGKVKSLEEEVEVLKKVIFGNVGS
jgi:hypothetical protein